MLPDSAAFRPYPTLVRVVTISIVYNPVRGCNGSWSLTPTLPPEPRVDPLISTSVRRQNFQYTEKIPSHLLQIYSQYEIYKIVIVESF